MLPRTNHFAQRKDMKTIDRINMYDLATAVISFGMVLGFAFR